MDAITYVRYAGEISHSGSLIGCAVGDALGAGYEGLRERTSNPVFLPGRLSGDPAGTFTDDTAMSICVLEAEGDLISPESLTKVAENFLTWRSHGPPDIGSTIKSVFRGTEDPSKMTEVSEVIHSKKRFAKSGNGSLMRTWPVGYRHPHDREKTAAAAAAVSKLTHPDPHAVEACIIWSELVRLGHTTGRFHHPEVAFDLVNDPVWPRIFDPEFRVPGNGSALGAFIGAWRAIETAQGHPVQSIRLAIMAGGDTDTVAAIAGALVGAVHGPDRFDVMEKFVSGRHPLTNEIITFDHP
jgi:ADP-ribosylglycohydrolase